MSMLACDGADALVPLVLRREGEKEMPSNLQAQKEPLERPG
jgi:hypothetical protein